MSSPVISVRDVWFSYGDEPVLAGVSFDVQPEEFVALVGPNGSGKSTLLRVLLGLLRPAQGVVTLLGTAPETLHERWRIGYVPQRPMLARDLPATVEEVVVAGRVARTRFHRRRSADRAEVEHALSAVGLADVRHQRVGALSGGQQQRAMIAKALVSEPSVLVLDEPIAGVDTDSQARFRESLVHLQQEHGVAILLVSHELSAVAADLDRVVVLRHGEVIFDGSAASLEAAGVSLGVHATDLPAWLEGEEHP
ncbi:MAG: metal ABC transporter ATP-binding protein [Acidimicrobiia bacterium]